MHSNNKSDDEIFKILKNIEYKLTSEEAFEKELINILHLKPNLFGIGIDFNNLFKRFKKRNKGNP